MCQRTLHRLSKAWLRAAGANSPETPKGRRRHLPSFGSPISCDVRRIACVMSRPWPPEPTGPAGGKSGRRSVGSRPRARNIGSAQRPRNADRKCPNSSGPEKSVGRLPDSPECDTTEVARFDRNLSASDLKHSRHRDCKPGYAPPSRGLRRISATYCRFVVIRQTRREQCIAPSWCRRGVDATDLSDVRHQELWVERKRADTKERSVALL